MKLVQDGAGNLYVTLSQKNIDRLREMLDDPHAIRTIYIEFNNAAIGVPRRLYITAESNEQHYELGHVAESDLDAEARAEFGASIKRVWKALEENHT